MSNISQAKFDVTYTGQHTDECSEHCDCEDTYDMTRGINALEVLEMAGDPDFYIDKITIGTRIYTVAEIATMVGHVRSAALVAEN